LNFISFTQTVLLVERKLADQSWTWRPGQPHQPIERLVIDGVRANTKVIALAVGSVSFLMH
jgi:hypothetical protein